MLSTHNTYRVTVTKNSDASGMIVMLADGHRPLFAL
jgi:hypothetical protein